MATPAVVTAAPSKPGLVDGSAPGFDKRDFPTLAEMQTWMRESPYVWVGYYLPSPCFAGRAWVGNRAQLEQQGWGLAVLYVGQQAPNSAMMTGAAATPSGDGPARNCGRNPLTTAQGSTDGDDAANIAAADGFPPGTTIFLDVERSDPMPPALDTYVRGWLDRVLARGYLAGIYAHKVNADALSASQRAAYAARNDARRPPFWVVNSIGFELGKPPAASGYPYATIWQNPTDANETWGGVTFRIDRNVATSRSPSSNR